MKRWAILCLLFCLSLPVYFGGKRVRYFLKLQSYDDYMNENYGAEGWPMHQYVASHIPKGSRIWMVGPVPTVEKYYWMDYDVFPVTVHRLHDYTLLIKANWPLNPDGSRTNTYLPALNLKFPSMEGKMWETDNAILYRG